MKKIFFIPVIVFSFSLVFFSKMEVQAQENLSGVGKFSLEGGSLCMNTRDSAKAWSPLIVFPCGQGANDEKFVPVKQSNGTYQIKLNGTNLCLNSKNGKRKGSQLILFPCGGYPDEKFYIEKKPSGYYQIRLADSNYCANSYYGKRAWSKVVMWNCNDSYNDQRWKWTGKVSTPKPSPKYVWNVETKDWGLIPCVDGLKRRWVECIDQNQRGKMVNYRFCSYIPKPETERSCSNGSQKLKIGNPVNGELRFKFNVDRSDLGGKFTFHAGEDWMAPAGSSVYAVADGKVIYTSSSGFQDGFIVIEHKDCGKSIYSFYGHLSSNIPVSPNQTVRKG